MGNSELILYFALLLYTTFVLPFKLSLFQPMTFPTFTFSVPIQLWTGATVWSPVCCQLTHNTVLHILTKMLLQSKLCFSVQTDRSYTWSWPGIAWYYKNVTYVLATKKLYLKIEKVLMCCYWYHLGIWLPISLHGENKKRKSYSIPLICPSIAHCHSHILLDFTEMWISD